MTLVMPTFNKGKGHMESKAIPPALHGHPCFDPAVRMHAARVHLPVAPGCNVQCRFCNRKFDCVNESRPGVTSTLLTPHQAVEYLSRLFEKGMAVSVAGIAGPGDAFADPSLTLATLFLVNKHFPELLLCLSTNGVAADPFAKVCASLGVTHATVTINAIDPDTASRCYAWARIDKRVLRGNEMGAAIIERQSQTIAAFVAARITVKVNIVVIPGINDAHIEEIAVKVASLGATLINCMPLLPTAGTDFSIMPKPDHELMQSVRWKASRVLPVMHHCVQCRADAAGLLGAQATEDFTNLLRTIVKCPRVPSERRPYIAVASREGIFINEHLGAARSLSIYDPALDERPITVRDLPEPGCGDNRWHALAAILADCRAILTYQCGEAPRRVLESEGLTVIETEGFISTALAEFRSGHVPHNRSYRIHCGQGRTGKGAGCG